MRPRVVQFGYVYLDEFFFLQGVYMIFFELFEMIGWIAIVIAIAVIIVCIKLILAIFEMRDALQSIDETMKEIAKNQDIIISQTQNNNY